MLRRRSRSIYFRRPFEILRLIRDGIVEDVWELELRDSRFAHFVHHFISGLKKLGLIEVSKRGKPKATEDLHRLLSTLDISLKQLSPVNPESIVSSPVFGLPSDPPKSTDLFVLMPFSDTLKPVYDDHIKAVAKTLKLTVARADDFFTADSIISDIWNAINAAKIIVADCTGRNPNVFYEIGIAHTLGKPVVLIAQSTEDIPFDVKHLRAVIYEFTPRGMGEFEEKFQSTITHELASSQSLEELIMRYRGDEDG